MTSLWGLLYIPKKIPGASKSSRGGIIGTMRGNSHEPGNTFGIAMPPRCILLLYLLIFLLFGDNRSDRYERKTAGGQKTAPALRALCTYNT